MYVYNFVFQQFTYINISIDYYLGTHIYENKLYFHSTLMREIIIVHTLSMKILNT